MARWPKGWLHPLRFKNIYIYIKLKIKKIRGNMESFGYNWLN
jgi:hypothetical protein